MEQAFAAHRRLTAGRYAAIDIGTVTCRMLTADVDADGSVRELGREYGITNLGEGVDASGLLKPEAIERVTRTVARYRGILDDRDRRDGTKTTVSAVATSAARDAANADELAASLASVGVELSIIPGEREAGLSFAGASCDFAGERLMVLDIGGGSTEVIAGAAQGSPSFAHSFNVGCRRVTEKFFRADPPAEAELDEARAWIAQTMRPVFDELRASGFAADRLVAVAGTATTVVAVREAMESYDTSRVHKALVTRSDLDDVHDRLRKVPTAERAAVPGLDPGRAPVIVAGMVILQTVLDLAGFDAFTVSESDILHGVILDAAANAEGSAAAR